MKDLNDYIIRTNAEVASGAVTIQDPNANKA